MTIELPPTLPLMTLPGTVLFPQTIAPLYIFEPRYRSMLADTLASERMFVLAKARPSPAASGDGIPCSIGTAGLIRASTMNADGTSTIALQGAQRVRITKTDHHAAYPVATLEPLPDVQTPFPNWEREIGRVNLVDLVARIVRLSGHESPEFLQACQEMESLDSLTFFALQAYSDDPSQNQRFLEMLDPRERFARALRFFEKQLQTYQLNKDISDKFSDGNGWSN